MDVHPAGAGEIPAVLSEDRVAIDEQAGGPDRQCPQEFAA
jgi:hypothetical protein